MEELSNLVNYIGFDLCDWRFLFDMDDLFSEMEYNLSTELLV